MNWGDNLTLMGAVRRTGWVTLGTKWRAMTGDAFLAWVRRSLAPRLREGDVVLLDNLKAHTRPAVRAAIERRGARVRYLPPYSHDFNPIESAWALVKKHIRTCAPRHAVALRQGRCCYESQSHLAIECREVSVARSTCIALCIDQ
jgi:transposase